jgi:NADH:ubiquinone oxidoreductase subunit 6 (subunit J)
VVRHRATLQRRLTIWDRYEAWAALSYLVGSALFAAGSVFFLNAVGWYTAGSWTFIIGGLLFVFGAVINVLEVTRAPDRRTLQLMNLTAITFVTGSMLFVVASIPYLFTLQSPADQRTVDAFLAGQYVIGSALFLLGGLFNYRRARTVALREGGQQRAVPASDVGS